MNPVFPCIFYGCNAVFTNIGINVIPVNVNEVIGFKRISGYYHMGDSEKGFF